METKKVKRYIDHGCGFPVLLENITMVKVRGAWTPKVNYQILAESVLRALALLKGRLTGDQIKFIRLHFQMTLQEFGKRFDVSHVAVMKWEKAGDEPTGMSWTTEKDIRLFTSIKLLGEAEEFKALYELLGKVTEKKAARVRVEAGELAA